MKPKKDLNHPKQIESQKLKFKKKNVTKEKLRSVLQTNTVLINYVVK